MYQQACLSLSKVPSGNKNKRNTSFTVLLEKKKKLCIQEAAPPKMYQRLFFLTYSLSKKPFSPVTSQSFVQTHIISNDARDAAAKIRASNTTL